MKEDRGRRGRGKRTADSSCEVPLPATAMLAAGGRIVCHLSDTLLTLVGGSPIPRPCTACERVLQRAGWKSRRVLQGPEGLCHVPRTSEEELWATGGDGPPHSPP